tara:strand:- start:156 stop:542 length:387 start_codon:yes stop_codon:yes gene_type:complete
MYVPVGDITDFLDGDDFYGEMAQRFAAGDSFQDRYLASAAADVIGAETQNAIDMATGALNRARDRAAGRDGYNPFDNPFVLNKVGNTIQDLWKTDNTSENYFKHFTGQDLDLGIDYGDFTPTDYNLWS